MTNNTPVQYASEDRRGSRRFQVNWDARVRGIDATGASFDEITSIVNLSSSGAFLPLATTVESGARVEVAIRVPLKKQNWMKYSGEIVRIEGGDKQEAVAVRFDTPRPIFSNR